MSYFLKLYRNVDCQRSYDNVRWFSTKTEQANYFAGNQIKSFDSCVPVKNTNSVIVEYSVDDLRTVPYMSFGENGGNKTVYAFIDSVQYLNEKASIINYTIDSFQTYMFELEIGETFVERENVTDDTIGANVVPEGLGLGEFVVNYVNNYDLGGMKIVLYTSIDANGDPVSGTIYDNVFTGVQRITVDPDNYSQINAIIEKATELGKADAIVAITMCPAICEMNGSQPYFFDKNYGSLNGYTPRNKKLYTYPYNYVLLSNNRGGKVELAYEDFDGDTCNFYAMGSSVGQTEVRFVPVSYKGVNQNYNYALTTKEYPQCPWSSSAFANWLGQNSVGSILSGVLSAGQTIVGGALLMSGVGSLAGAGLLASGLYGGISNMSTMYTQSSKPPEVHGSMGTNLVAIKDENSQGYRAYAMSIKKDVAQSIDDYFSKFGYRVNKFKVPNINTHSEFNYVKTVGCDFSGNIPADNLNEIINAFDKGVTLWHTSFSRTAYLTNEVVNNG